MCCVNCHEFCFSPHSINRQKTLVCVWVCIILVSLSRQVWLDERAEQMCRSGAWKSGTSGSVQSTGGETALFVFN